MVVLTYLFSCHPCYRLEPLDLLVQPVRHTALQNRRNILIQLAVLLSEGRHRYRYRRLDLTEMRYHLAELVLYRPRLGDRLACHHSAPPLSPFEGSETSLRTCVARPH